METIQKQFKTIQKQFKTIQNNSNLFNFLKTGVLMILLLLINTGCEKDLNEDNLNTHFSLIETRILTGNEKDIVTNKLKTLLENKLDKQNKLTIQTNRTTLEVVEYTDVIAITGENGAVNYTFSVENSGIVAHKFYNLILEERNEYSTVLLAEYTMTADFATDYFLGTKDFSEFQGSIAYTQIMNNNPCPPINYPITVGTSGGGATTGGGSGISSGGGFTGGSGGAGSVTVICNDCSRNFSSIKDLNSTKCAGYTYTIYVSLRIAPIPSLPVTNPCPEDTLPIAVAPADRTTIRINNLLGNILLPNQLSLLTSNSTEADKILTFLLENNTIEGKEFAKLAIDALINNGEVDYFDKIINNLTGKAACVYKKLKDNSILNKTLEKFVGEKTPVHLIVDQKSNLRERDNDPNSPLINGKTYYGTSYYIIITLNTEQVNSRPSLAVVRTILHEAIHAEIYRKIKTTSGMYFDSFNNEWKLPDGSRAHFPTLFDNFNDDPNNPHHHYMANYYRTALEEGLKEYAALIGETHSDQFYKDFVWNGLLETKAWQNQYTDPVFAQNEKNRIINVISNYENSRTNECQ